MDLRISLALLGGLLCAPLSAVAQEDAAAASTPASDERRFEFVLYPVAVHPSELATHFGGSASAAWFAKERGALRLRFSHRLGEALTSYATTARNDPRELVDGVIAVSQWSLLAEAEGVLAQRDLELFGGGVRLGVSMGLRAGVTSARAWLWKWEEGPAPRFDLGVRPAAGLLVSGRARLGTHLVVRLDVASLTSPFRIDRAQGCDLQELTDLDAAARAGRPLNDVPLTRRCDRAYFSANPSHAGAARELVRAPSGSEFFSQINVQAGVGAIF